MERSSPPQRVPRSPSPPFDLILITEPTLADPATFVRAALADLHQGERVAVQLRAKAWTEAQRTEAAHALRELTHKARCALLINGDLELCVAAHADGAQLPEDGPSIAAARARLGADSWIGVSCHNAARLADAAREHADFALLAPWGPVPNKAPALGAERFGEICRSVPLPVYALGGIGLHEIPAAISRGAHGVAVIREVHQAEHPAIWVRNALILIEQARASMTTRTP